MEISTSDIYQFLRCRRAWDFQSQNRQGLVRAGIPTTALHVGTGVHVALAAQAVGDDPRRALLDWHETEVASFVEHYRATVGCEPSPAEIAPLLDAYNLAGGLCVRYFDRYCRGDLSRCALGERYRYLAVEQTFRVPIPDTDGFFMGTFDGVAEDVESGSLWIVEHKTYGHQRSYEQLTTNEQFTGYVWAAQALLGRRVDGVLYDGLRRALPEPPALLKSGKLSQAWSTTIDYLTYLAAIDLHGQDPNDYADILARLKERDAAEQTPFYARWKLPVLTAQVDAFAGYLPAIYREMAGGPAIYPFFDPLGGCANCFVRDLCRAVQFGEDVSYLVSIGYRRGSGSQSFQKRLGRVTEIDYAALAA